VDVGFVVRAALRATDPFAVVDVPKASCLLALGDAASSKLGLRLKGGALALAPAANLAWCASAESTVVVQRDGSSEATILVAPAAPVGGVAGLREVARSADLALVAGTPSGDEAWNAKQFLLASAMPEMLITTASTPEVGPEPDARVVALSFRTPGALSPELETDVYSYCEPSLGGPALDVFCIFSGAQKWRPASSEAVGGVARAKLPFWLYTMQAVSDPVALKGETRLFSLARRLKREGFEPTTLEATTELANGVEVSGRAGEDAIVAVGIAPAPPWVFPYTDGAPWSLDGAPRIIALKALAKITLSAAPHRTLPPKATRRTVVFRRLKR
jgi:hypothetical protein